MFPLNLVGGMYWLGTGYFHSLSYGLGWMVPESGCSLSYNPSWSDLSPYFGDPSVVCVGCGGTLSVASLWGCACALTAGISCILRDRTGVG